MHRSLMILAVGGLAVVLLGVGGAAFWFERPTTLSVAVSTGDPDDLALMTAAAAQMKRSRQPVRLKILPFNDAAAAAGAIDEQKTDLAVVRTDLAMPTDGQTVIILHRDAAILVAPASGDVREINDLGGRKIGLVHSGPANNRLLETALAQYDIRLDPAQIEPLQPSEVGEAIRGKRVAAVMAVDVVSSSLMHG